MVAAVVAVAMVAVALAAAMVVVVVATVARVFPLQPRLTSTPIEPESTLSSPARQRRRVLLPTPFTPISPTRQLCPSVRDASLNCLRTPL